MKRLAFLLTAALLLPACATVQGPPPLEPAQIVELAKSASAPQIIEELKRTNTVLFLSASDVVRLHEAGVPAPVLDYLQQRAYDEMRWRDYQAQMFWYGPYGPLYRGYGWGPCRPGWRC